MRAYLYQLRFVTPVHFGASDSALSLHVSEDHFCADTLFSALCHTASAMDGSEAASALCEEARQGNLLLSDSMPWMRLTRESRTSTEADSMEETTFFLPRPMLVSSSDVPPERLKAMKKRNWLPVRMMDAFLSSIGGTANIDPEEIPRYFGKTGVAERAAIPRAEGEDAEPYPVGLFQFRSNCGLYFIALFKDEKMERRFCMLLTGLGLSGIGGKASSGYGKFTLENAADLDAGEDGQSAWLRDALRRDDSPSQLMLTSSLPHREELDTALNGASFQLIRRAGFVQPASVELRGEKKRTQYFLAAGSVLCHRFSGEIYSVREGDSTPVVRYSRPVFLGLPQR